MSDERENLPPMTVRELGPLKNLTSLARHDIIFFMNAGSVPASQKRA